MVAVGTQGRKRWMHTTADIAPVIVQVFEAVEECERETR
jgi:hypothetical protein